MRPPNKEIFEVYRSFPVIKFACSLFFKLSERDLKDLLASSERRRERDLKDLLASSERRRDRD